jgi:hypothetical protein
MEGAEARIRRMSNTLMINLQYIFGAQQIKSRVSDHHAPHFKAEPASGPVFLTITLLTRKADPASGSVSIVTPIKHY